MSALVSLEGHEQVGVARVSVEVPVGQVVRPWAAAGVWDLLGWSCLAVAECHLSGPTAELGVDLAPLGASSRLQPFVGAGAGIHYLDAHERELSPLVRVGADLQLWRRVAPRVQVEWTRYPVQGRVLLWTVGLRIGVGQR